MKRVVMFLLSIVTVITFASKLVTPASADMMVRNQNVKTNNMITHHKFNDGDNDRDDLMSMHNRNINQNVSHISSTQFFFSRQFMSKMSFNSNMVRF